MSRKGILLLWDLSLIQLHLGVYGGVQSSFRRYLSLGLLLEINGIKSLGCCLRSGCW